MPREKAAGGKLEAMTTARAIAALHQDQSYL